MKKNLLLSILFFATIGMYSCSDTALDDVDSHVSDIQTEKSEVPIGDPEADADFQWKAIQQMDRINARFQNVPLGPGDTNFPYPGYYGGAYINDDGKLVVYVKGNSDKLKRKVYELVGDEDVIIRRANHSMGTLNKIMNNLNAFKADPANASKSANWNSYSMRDADNEILVLLDNYSDAEVKNFRKNVMNHPAIRFEKSNGQSELEASVQPGCKHFDGNSGTVEAGSYAFRAKYGTRTGMVVSGHVIENKYDPVYDPATLDYVGSCVVSKFGGSVDAAFVEVTNSSYIPSNLICNQTNYLSTTTSRPGAGTVVNKVGYKTGRTSGKIISTNASATFLGVNFTNMTSADYVSDGGDSGGIIYTYISSSNTRYTVGVHQGVFNGEKIFSKADLVMSALSVTRY
ncbi:MAG: hypothetical protein WBB45_12455 [Cyclobacteriaceae bacterium]